MKAAEEYFTAVLLIMLYKIVLTFSLLDEILKCDLSSESYWAVLSYGAVYYTVQDSSSFEPVNEIPNGVTSQIKDTKQQYPLVLFLTLWKMVLT